MPLSSLGLMANRPRGKEDPHRVYLQYFIPVILELGRLRQAYHKLKTNLGYRMKTCL